MAMSQNSNKLSPILEFDSCLVPKIHTASKFLLIEHEILGISSRYVLLEKMLIGGKLKNDLLQKS